MEELLRTALAGLPATWRLVTGTRLERLRRGIELVLVTPGAVLAFGTDAAAIETAALDLADFHAGCAGLPVLPVVLVAGQRVLAQSPLPIPGAARVIACTRLQLPGLLHQVARFPPYAGFDPAAWDRAPYRPVPGLLHAACALYANHGAAALRLASSGRGDLLRTQAAIARALARAPGDHSIIFVTGAPGAGKTLCGLDLAFRPAADATFLTGNPALLHVLRAALVRDAAARGLDPRAARRRVEAVVQPLHGFRDQYAPGGVPPDRLLVIDEAQRCWTDEYAVRKTLNKPVRLIDSEPGHLLDIMQRQPGGCAIVCLLGGGQEIHAGEGGLATWGEALAARPAWRAWAPPAASDASDPRQRLPALPGLTLDPDLHLGQPVRAFRTQHWVAWVDAVLEDRPADARRLAGPGLPVRLTRSLDAMRAALRRGPPGRAGLLASAGARRLRAEGLGGLLWHQDADAVAQWFLDTWPDIRGSDALEVAATEFGAQGLELDRAGLCWDLDLARRQDGSGWEARAFRATNWTSPGGEALSNKRNAYRVLLTRARRQTVIWVPRGAWEDRTRSPARYDAVVAYLLDCGARTLDEAAPAEQDARMPEPALL